jgi:hypothetical protein
MNDRFAGGRVVPVLAVEHTPAQVERAGRFLVLAHAVVMFAGLGAEAGAGLVGLFRIHGVGGKLPAGHVQHQLAPGVAHLQRDRRQLRREVFLRLRWRARLRRRRDTQVQRRRGECIAILAAAVAEGRIVGVLWQDAVTGSFQRLRLFGGDRDVDHIRPVRFDRDPGAMAVKGGDRRGHRR